MKKSVLFTSLLTLGAVLPALASCGKEDNKVVIYTAAEEERIDYLKAEVSKKYPDIEVVFQAIGTGNLVAKLQAEGKSTDCDIFYDLEICNAQKLCTENKELFYDLGNDYDFSIYDDSVTGYTDKHHMFAVNGKTCGTIVVNTKVLSNNGLVIPTAYNDLLDSKYKDLVVMPSPKSSGTGYAFYNGLVSSIGKDAAYDYFDKLDANMKEYTTSGSAPVKSVNRGEAAVGVCLLWQGVQYANENEDLKVVFLNNEASYNLFTMGMINGKEKKSSVKTIFDYLYNDLNKTQVTKYNPDKIYKNQGAAEIPNYPTEFTEITMVGAYDYEYKNGLLEDWKH